MSLVYLSVIIGFAAALASFLGGVFAIRLKDRLHLILGFSAGAVLGVAFFDLMPEAIEIGAPFYSAETILMYVAIGFLAFTVFERSIGTHDHETDREPKGGVAAISLALHSFFDGAAIGLAFQVSAAVGAVVAAAVLAHKFSDGVTIVSLVLRRGGSKLLALRWLFANSAAPIVGVFSTMFFTLPDATLAIILAIFSGFFLYISASDLLPESYHGHPTKWTTLMTVVGAAVLFFVIQLAGH